jgi:hypothetical protein
MLKCNFQSFPVDWEDVLREGLAVWRGKSLVGVIYKLPWLLQFIIYGGIEII